MPPLVSVIVVNWNAGKYLRDCISSILNQTYHNYEIILVDNASSDGSVDEIENHFQQVRIIKNQKNLGFAGGNNVGIQNARGSLIALLNPDAIADKDWLLNLVAEIQKSDTIAGAMGKIFYLGNQYGENAVFCTWPKLGPFSARPYNFHNDEPSAKVDYLSGAAMVVKKEVLDKIGLLDVDYFVYFEETDWCARMVRAGYDLMYIPNAIAWHVVSPSTSSDNKIYYMERNRVRFAIKNFDFIYLPIFFSILFFETSAILLRDIKNLNFMRSKIRLRAILWNFNQIRKTLKSKENDLSKLRKITSPKSYNRSLPLRKITI